MKISPHSPAGHTDKFLALTTRLLSAAFMLGGTAPLAAWQPGTAYPQSAEGFSVTTSDRTDVLAFWFGESDEVTPDFVREAAIESLRAGETFYAHNLGLPELRQALERLSQHWGQWHTVPQAGHWVVYEAAEAFNAALLQVLGPADRQA